MIGNSRYVQVQNLSSISRAQTASLFCLKFLYSNDSRNSVTLIQETIHTSQIGIKHEYEYSSGKL
jgi:hypothetical protein